MAGRSVGCVFCALVILLRSSVCVSAQWATDDEGCRTPDRGVGNCIPISDCETIMDVFQDAAQPLSTALITFLRSYQCGIGAGRSIKVCCPRQPIVNRLVKYQPVSVRNHPKLRLLPMSTCGVTAGEGRIINGNKTGVFDFPWMALLSYFTNDEGLQFRCGGSIINNRYILTAAHCITNLKDKRIVGVRVGEHDIDTKEDCDIEDGVRVCAEPVQDIAVEKVIPHEKYDTTTYSYDVGLIRLARPINTSVDTVVPICLPVSDKLMEYNFNNKTALVTGWGITETGRSSSDLRKAELPITPHKDCQETYKRVTRVTHRHICAGGTRNIDSCEGDSGGPLQIIERLGEDVRYFQVGIVSFGPKFCALEGFPGVYTKIAFYLEWILNNLEP